MDREAALALPLLLLMLPILLVMILLLLILLILYLTHSLLSSKTLKEQTGTPTRSTKEGVTSRELSSLLCNITITVIHKLCGRTGLKSERNVK